MVLGNRNNIIIAYFVALFVLLNNVYGLAAGDHRSHVFGTQDHPQILDEGYRWRNSLNFTISTPATGEFGAIVNEAIENWWFHDGDVIDQNGGFINLNNPGDAQMVINPGFVQHQTGADGIHRTLSTVVNGIIGLGIGEHAAAGAITIVIRNPNNGNLEAYSEVIRDSMVCPQGIANQFVIDTVSVALPRPNLTPQRTYKIADAGFAMYYSSQKEPQHAKEESEIEKNERPQGTPIGHYNVRGIYGSVEKHVHAISDLVNANIPAFPAAGEPPAPTNGYGCCEGQIVARLFDNDVPSDVDHQALQPLFPQVIRHLVVQADSKREADQQEIPITDNHIILVVLHIHTHQDPCAKCSKVLSGLSKQMNMPIHNPANQYTQTQGMSDLLNTFAATANLITRLRAGTAKFLIEVSSDTCYHLRIDADHPCSHTEIAGHDGGDGNAVNINTDGIINFAGAAAPNGPYQLGIPGENNWVFPGKFPPYVVYKRIDGLALPCICENPHHMNPLPLVNLGIVN